jgi:hypothetical protein
VRREGAVQLSPHAHRVSQYHRCSFIRQHTHMLCHVLAAGKQAGNWVSCLSQAVLQAEAHAAPLAAVVHNKTNHPKCVSMRLSSQPPKTAAESTAYSLVQAYTSYHCLVYSRTPSPVQSHKIRYKSLASSHTTSQS